MVLESSTGTATLRDAKCCPVESPDLASPCIRLPSNDEEYSGQRRANFRSKFILAGNDVMTLRLTPLPSLLPQCETEENQKY